MSLEGQFKALEGNNAVDDELAKMKGLVSIFFVESAFLRRFLFFGGVSTFWCHVIL